MITTYSSINRAFEERYKNLESIFSSFRSLHEMYISIMATANVNKNALTAYERIRNTAADESDRISRGLYAQGFVLLTGSAEALLKDVFESLLIENFTEIKVAGGVNFSIREIQEVMKAPAGEEVSYDNLNSAFGNLVIKKLFKDTKNAAEKISFQNVRTMKETFNQYFSLNIDLTSTTDAIHRSWQVRHCLVHNDSVVDERFVNNVGKVNLLREGEVAGARITITKDDYNETKGSFIELFDHLTTLIEEAELKSRFVDVDQDEVKGEQRL